MAALFCTALMLLAGCCGPKPKEAYYGPTLLMDDVVEKVNRNSGMIPSLWANTDFSATVVDEKGDSHSGGGSGVVIFRRPGDLLVRGDSLIGPVFEVGSNNETYWLQLLLPQIDKAWFGSYANLGRSNMKQIPILPDALVEVFGVSIVNTNFLQQPVPVMKFNHEDDAYEFTFMARLPDRWFAAKQISYDRKTYQPTHVVLYDENGRTVLKADLSDPAPVEVPELPKTDWPKVATKYDLYFPESKIRLSMTLSDVALNKGKVPIDATFRMPGPDQWGVTRKENVIDVDSSPHH